MREHTHFGEYKEIVLKECQNALDRVDDEAIEELIAHIVQADKVFFIGVGRVMLALQAIAKRLGHLGIKTYCVGQITEPAITTDDVLIVGSGSGESLFPLAIAKKAKSLQVNIVHIGSNPNSSMKQYANVFIRIPVSTKLKLENEIQSVQPMTALFEQTLYLLGDIVALAIISKHQINVHDLWKYHANLE